MGSVIRWVIRAIGALLAVMVVIVAITTSLAIPINLNLLRGPITWAVSKAIDREVDIEGSLQVKPGLWPTVTIAGLRIANPSPWQTPDFARIQQLHLRLGIVPLLEGQLHLAEIAVKDAAVSLETNRRGDTNWPFPKGGGLLDSFAVVGLDNVSVHRIAITYRDEDATRFYALQVEQMKGTAAPEEALRLTGQGTFQQQAYTFLLTGGPIADLSTARRSWPMALTADSVGAHLQLTGNIAPATQSTITTLDWELSGKRVGDLAAWFDVSPESNLPYAAQGRLRLADTSLRLDDLALQLGSTSLSGELALTGIPTERHCLGNLHFTVIDREELGNIFRPTESAADLDENVILNMGIVNHIPFLTKLAGFNNAEIVAVKSVAGLFKLLKLHQAEINLAADRIVLPPTDITDVKVTFAGQFRDAWRLHIPSFQASLGRNRVTGDYSARGRPDGELDLATTLTAQQVDIGDLLHSFGIVEDAQGSMGQVTVTAASHGKSLREILTQADFQVTVANGQWIPPDHQTLGSLPIRLNQARVSVLPGQPVTLLVDGRVADTPVRLAMQSHSVAKLINAGERLPIRLAAQVADAQLELVGGVGLPLDQALLGAEITLAGDHLANLNGLLGIELPRLGPYSLAAGISVIEDYVSLSELKVHLGQNHLAGSVRLDTTGDRPYWDINLISDTLQLDDFMEHNKTAAPPAEDDEASDNAKAQEVLEVFLQPSEMQTADGRLAIEAKRILWGSESLGGISLTARLDNGRLSITPLRLTMPGGSADLGVVLEPTATELAAEATARIAHLDYTTLAQQLAPENPLSGFVHLDMNLEFRTPNLDGILNNLNGHVNVIVWPEQVEAGMVDLFALNLVTALLPFLDAGTEAKTNCLIGRFTITDGIVTPQEFIIDTTRVRALGVGELNLKTEEITLVMLPRVKNRTLFSLATPVQVGGTMSDFQISVSVTDLLTLLANLSIDVYSPVLGLWLTLEDSPPADGSDICAVPAVSAN